MAMLCKCHRLAQNFFLFKLIRVFFLFSTTGNTLWAAHTVKYIHCCSRIYRVRYRQAKKYTKNSSDSTGYTKFVYEIVINREVNAYKSTASLIDSVSAFIEVIDHYCGSCSSLVRIDDHKRFCGKFVSDQKFYDTKLQEIHRSMANWIENHDSPMLGAYDEIEFL